MNRKHLPIIGWEHLAMIHIEKIYDSEINFTIETFWDGGYTVKLGDTVNGFIDKAECEVSFSDAIEVLINMILKHYPNSTYAKWVLGE